MVMCDLYPSESLSRAWLETVNAEVMKSSLVHSNSCHFYLAW